MGVSKNIPGQRTTVYNSPKVRKNGPFKDIEDVENVWKAGSKEEVGHQMRLRDMQSPNHGAVVRILAFIPRTMRKPSKWNDIMMRILCPKDQVIFG